MTQAQRPTCQCGIIPDGQQAIVHHFNVGGYEWYLTVGFYKDGSPGEIFITTAKEGSTVSDEKNAAVDVFTFSDAAVCK